MRIDPAFAAENSRDGAAEAALQRGELPWLEFELPSPPSVNRYMGKLGNRSPVVQKWIKQADMAFILSGSNRAKSGNTITQIRCAYEAEFIFARRANSDLDNRCKPLMDYLQRVGIVENDRMCERLLARWGSQVEVAKGRVIVRLRPWMRASSAE